MFHEQKYTCTFYNTYKLFNTIEMVANLNRNQFGVVNNQIFLNYVLQSALYPT